MKDFRLYAEGKGKQGYCQRCIDHSNLSNHLLGKNGSMCPMCQSIIFDRNDVSKQEGVTE